MKRIVAEMVLSLMLLGILAVEFRFQPVGVDGKHLMNGNLTTSEANVVAMVDGLEAYLFDVQLESIALSHYAFRSAGSAGANEAADWIAGQFQTFGLEVEKEEFQFITWDLLSKPLLIIDDDDNLATTNDQTIFESFRSAHYSWAGDVFADLVVLPLPPATDYYEIGATPIGNLWDAIDTSGKVILVGIEIRSDGSWHEAFHNKLRAQPPIAVIYTLWYDWMAFVPDFGYSGCGVPITRFGHYYWELGVPVGIINHDDGMLIRSRENSVNVSARVVIDSVIDFGPHYNVVGKLTGYAEPDRLVIVSGHYDTPMCPGFCDNGAGTSGVLELARVFTEATREGVYYPKFSILFVAFASEEIHVVGSTNYVIQHKAEMENIVAVINLDGIGSDELYVVETNPTEAFDLDEVVLESANDLGISVGLTDLGSDDLVFSNPVWANDHYSWAWELDAGIDDATPVESSTCLISYPLTYRDKWNMGTPGWAHTSYDNSTSTETLSWIEVDDLQDHARLAALTVMRVSPSSMLTDLNQDGIVNIQDITIVAIAYKSIPGDPRWNEVADLDKNNVIDILDITKVAIDYGKTV